MRKTSRSKTYVTISVLCLERREGVSRGVGNIHVRLMLLLGQDIPASSFLCKGFDPPPIILSFNLVDTMTSRCVCNFFSEVNYRRMSSLLIRTSLGLNPQLET